MATAVVRPESHGSKSERISDGLEGCPGSCEADRNGGSPRRAITRSARGSTQTSTGAPMVFE